MLRERLQHALELREFLFEKPYYRWVHSEGDFLPGLTVDRYGDVLVVQITTAGMEIYRDDIIDALQSKLPTASIQLRNDGKMRELEHLHLYREWVSGQSVDLLSIHENGLHFEVPSELGQKTGWFYESGSVRS